MSYKMNGLIAAMEEIDNEPVAVDGDEAVKLVETVADDSATVQADADEVGVSVSQVEDAVQAGGELEDIADVASEAVESGEGLDESAAEMASIAIESIRNRLGIRGESRLVPATESFGNVNTRVMSTRLIVENIGDTLKRIWAAIKAAAARIWDKIRSFFAGLFKSTEGLIKLINSLRDRARKVPSGANQKEKSLKHEGVARGLGVDKEANFSTYERVYANTIEIADVIKKIAGNDSKIVSGARDVFKNGVVDASTVDTYLKGLDTNAESVERVLTSAFKVLTGDAASGIAGVSADARINDVSKYQSKKDRKSTTAKPPMVFGPFAGGVALVYVKREHTEAGKSYVNFDLSFTGTKGKSASKIAALDLSQIHEILAKSLSLAAKLNDIKKTESEINTIVKSIQRTADDVMTNSAKILDKTGSSTETRLGLEAARSSINDTLKMINSLAARGPALQFQLAKLGADYASISLRNLGEKAFGK